MNVQPKKIMSYGREGLVALQRGKRIFSLLKGLPLFYRRKARKHMKKQERKAMGQEKAKQVRWAMKKLYQRMVYGIRLLVAVKRRYF